MTVAPQHPPVHAYDGADPYEIIESKWGKVERWRALAMATGEAGALTSLSKQVRADFASIVARQDARDAQLNSRQDALDERERQIGVMAAQVSEMAGRLSVEWDKLLKARADQQEEPLPTPPGDPSDPGDDPNKPPEPSLELEDTNGDLPDPGDPAGEFPRLTKPVALDQTEFPTGELPTPPFVKQPIAAGLDDGD